MGRKRHHRYRHQKGDHLIVEGAGRKLFHIDKTGTGPNLTVRLVKHGPWNNNIERANQVGFTLWTLKNGKPHRIHAKGVGKAVQACLRPQKPQVICKLIRKPRSFQDRGFIIFTPIPSLTSHQRQLKLFTETSGSFVERMKRHGVIFRVEKSIH